MASFICNDLSVNVLKRGVFFLLALSLLSACSEQRDDVSVRDIKQAYLRISFDDGPNKGAYVYRKSADPVSQLSLTYHEKNNATFLIAQRLQAEDERIQLDEMQRFVSGKLRKGRNTVSDWQGKPLQPSVDGSKPCGELKLRDRHELMAYSNAYGVYLECDSFTVDSISKWQDSDDAGKQVRMVRGQFQDTLRLNITNDDAPFQRIETQVTVEFNLPQERKIK